MAGDAYLLKNLQFKIYRIIFFRGEN